MPETLQASSLKMQKKVVIQIEDGFMTIRKNDVTKEQLITSLNILVKFLERVEGDSDYQGLKGIKL